MRVRQFHVLRVATDRRGPHGVPAESAAGPCAFLLVALLVLSLAFAMQMLEAGHSYPEVAQASRSGNSVLSNWR